MGWGVLCGSAFHVASLRGFLSAWLVGKTTALFLKPVAFFPFRWDQP